MFLLSEVSKMNKALPFLISINILSCYMPNEYRIKNILFSASLIGIWIAINNYILSDIFERKQNN